MADTPEQEGAPRANGMRKTVTFTQKQFGGGLGIGAALLALQPMFNTFMTNDKAETMRVQTQHLATNQAEIKATIHSTHEDLTKAITEGNRLIMQTIRDAEGRTAMTDKRHDRLIERIQIRLDSYEASTQNHVKAQKHN